MYIIQCGDYNHLIDWIETEEEEENPSSEGNNEDAASGEAIKKCETNTTVLVSPPSKSTPFIIYDKIAFETHVLPAIFKEGKFDSFERKLYRWGFAKKKREVTGRRRSVDSSNSSIYEHPYFCKGDYMTASTIACSGSEVKRYRQMQKDQKNRGLQKRRRRSKVSSANSSGINLDTATATANLDEKMATTGKNAGKPRPSTAADNQSFLYREDRWDELYLSAFHCPPKKEDNMGSAYFRDNNRTKGKDDDEGLESLDLIPTSSAMLASSRVQHQHDHQKEQNDVRTQSIGLLTATSAQYTREQAMLLGNSHSSDITFGSLQQEVDDILADEDVVLLHELRRRHNDRENILKMIQRSFQK